MPESETELSVRRYSPLEIDQMRDLIHAALSAELPDYSHGDYYYPSKFETVDRERLQRDLLVHIANGTTVSELEEYAAEKKRCRSRRRQWVEAAEEARRRFCQHQQWSKPRYGEQRLACITCGQPDRRREDRNKPKVVPGSSPVTAARKRRWFR